MSTSGSWHRPWCSDRSSSTGDSGSPTTTTGTETSDSSSTAPVGTSTGAVDPGTSTTDPTTGTPGGTSSTGPGETTLPDSTTGRSQCNDFLDARVRDFKASHPDFEDYGGALLGIVEPDLGADKKPVYAAAGATAVTTGPDAFAQWYNDTPDVNIAEPTQLMLRRSCPAAINTRAAPSSPSTARAGATRATTTISTSPPPIYCRATRRCVTPPTWRHISS